MDLNFNYLVKASLERALFGIIEPNSFLRFYYDLNTKEIGVICDIKSNLNKENLSLIETEIMADFPNKEINLYLIDDYKLKLEIK